VTRKVNTADPLRDTLVASAREASAAWGWMVALGALWIGYGMFVLSFQVGSLLAVASLVGMTFLLGGTTQLVVASREQTMRLLNIIGGILGVAGGLTTFAWPGITVYVVSIMVAWYLIAYGTIHIVTALAGPKPSWWWTGLLGLSELVLGAWAARFWGPLPAHPGHPRRGVGHQPRSERDLRGLLPAPGRQESRPATRLTPARVASSGPAAAGPEEATPHTPRARLATGCETKEHQ